MGKEPQALGEDGQSSGGSGAEGDPWGDRGPGWHVATHTALVAVAICVTLLLGCCCSVVLVFGWRDTGRGWGDTGQRGGARGGPCASLSTRWLRKVLDCCIREEKKEDEFLL
ncbi:hypothetical protein WMY93_023377 [Mugilogobius chulae]|uniref:Uncharacterized protein n=1 Tax=Mugilogobius chulae TaxID=88201 RepID=A0AAW0NGH9_9GOBI